MSVKGVKLINLSTKDKFNHLSFVRDVPLSSKSRHRRCVWLCDCGKKKEIFLTSVVSGHTKSCGCIRKGLKMKNKYGVPSFGKSRLYKCWISMGERSRKRKDCNIFHEWDMFIPFRDWSLDSGYTDDKVLCRTGDVGDYEPGNVRWDTTASNVSESHCKSWIVTTPSGEDINVDNLPLFCKNQDINISNLRASMRNNRMYRDYKLKLNGITIGDNNA